MQCFGDRPCKTHFHLKRDQLRALAALAGGEQRAAAAWQACVVAAQAAAGRALVAVPQLSLTVYLQALRAFMTGSVVGDVCSIITCLLDIASKRLVHGGKASSLLPRVVRRNLKFQMLYLGPSHVLPTAHAQLSTSPVQRRARCWGLRQSAPQRQRVVRPPACPEQPSLRRLPGKYLELLNEILRMHHAGARIGW